MNSNQEMIMIMLTADNQVRLTLENDKTKALDPSDWPLEKLSYLVYCLSLVDYDD